MGRLQEEGLLPNTKLWWSQARVPLKTVKTCLGLRANGP